MPNGQRNVAIDQDQLDALKPACARILSQGGALRGTGYLVGPDLVVTCDHVLWNPRPPQRDASVRCQFGDAGGADIEATVLRFDETGDAALLKLEHPLAGVKPLALAAPEFLPLTWYAFGFPGFVDGLGVVLTGDILDARARDREGKEALSIYSPMLAGGTPNLGGFSGSPVLSNGKVVGHLYRLLAAPGQPQEAQLGIAYVMPVRTYQGFVGQAVTPAQPTVPGPMEADLAEAAAVAGKRCVVALRAAGSPADVRAALAGAPATGQGGDAPRLIGAETLLGMGDPDGALGLLKETPASERHTQLEALALSLLGKHAEAHALLNELPVSDETAGLAGGVLKRRWLQSGNRAWLSASHQAYLAEYERKKTPYVGINVAATALYLGQPELCQTVAQEVARALEVPGLTHDHWYFATVAEAALLQDDLSAARTSYGRAVGLRPGNTRDIAVMRRQARLDLHHLGLPRNELDDLFPVGGIAAVIAAPVVIGPALDTDRLDEEIERRRVQFGFGSGFRGGDIVFAERLRARDGTAKVFLPSPRDEFEPRWVEPGWSERFRAIAAGAVVVPAAKDENGFASCNRAVMREALEMGRRLDERPVLIAICPRTGMPDPRNVRSAVAEWNDGGTTDRETAVVIEAR